MEERLRKFSKLVDSGSYTKAAAVLHISQPALTSAIQKLERELKTELIIKHGRSIKLTPAGAYAYKAAQEISQSTSNLKRMLADDDNLQHILRVGLIDSIAEQLFAKNSQTPIETTGLSIMVDNSRRLIENVAKGELDCAIITNKKQAITDMAIKHLGNEPFCLVATSRYISNNQQQLNARIIPSFLGYNQSSNTYSLIDDYLKTNGYSIKYGFYSTSPQVLLELATTSMGVAALPRSMVDRQIASNELQEIELPKLLWRQIFSIHRSGTYIGTQATALTRSVEVLLGLPQPK